MGDREIEEDAAESVDLRDFQPIDCPVCKGKGKFKGDDCPACGGDATMERRFAERIDPRDYLTSHALCAKARAAQRSGLS